MKESDNQKAQRFVGNVVGSGLEKRRIEGSAKRGHPEGRNSCALSIGLHNVVVDTEPVVDGALANSADGVRTYCEKRKNVIRSSL